LTEVGDSRHAAGISELPGPIPKAAIGATVAIWILLAGQVFVRSLDPDAFNYDVAWVLHCAERMLDSARLYVDVIDENPPLIFWISVPPVWLARLLGLPPVLVFDLCVVLLAAASAALCHRILRESQPESSALYRVALIQLAACLLVLLPGADFGQREHLLSIAVIPYLFGAAARASGRLPSTPYAIAAGLLAGLGLAIKPFFLLLWLAVEGYLLWSARGRWKCPENAVIGGVQAIHLLAVAVFAPHYRDVVAMTAQVISAYRDFSPLKLLKPAAVWHVVVACGGFALVRSGPLDRALRNVLLVAALALLVNAIVQGTDWRYHYLPADVVALLLIGVIALGLFAHADALRTVLRPPATALPLIGLTLLCVWSGAALLSAASAAFGWAGEPRSLVRALTRVVRERAAGEPIWVMSSSINPAFPVVNLSGASWSSRFCCVWMAPGLYSAEEKATRPFPYRDRDEMTELERFQIDAVIEDLEAAPPRLLIVDNHPHKQAWGQSDFQFLAYFRRDPRFARLFLQYRPVGPVGPFQIYERKTSAN
jgi:hypothetical protein